ncbi:MAG: M20/M25/M40 family metallo-hydrolase [Flavobacteriales bacterium]|nr:M20/M25/M40 family metallo-hydrolase [Flavobacteriales bacterium]
MPKRRHTGQSTRIARALWLLLMGICQQGTVDAQAPLDRLRSFDRAAQQDAQGYRWLRWSVEAIGHRLTGSPEGARAEASSDSLFRLAGLPHVERFPFSAQAWSRGRVQLTIGDGHGFLHLGAVALANTPLEADVEAPLIDAGNGLPADLDRLGDALRGKLALVNIGLVDAPEGTRNLHRSEKAALALGRGVAGIVFVNQVEGGVLLTGTASIDGQLIPVPAACVATEDGANLRQRLAQGAALSARLGMNNDSRVVEAHNVIAEIPGSRWPQEVIMVGGHLDSWDLATGATDNGLGAYSILDLARAMQAMPFRPERTVRFVLFMGEEQGLLGSRALVRHYEAAGELANIRCMINLDMSGNPYGFGVGGPQGWAELMGRLNEDIRAATDGHFRGELSEQVWLHSDHQPFLMSGVPVIYPLSDLGKHVYGCYHSSCDDIHLVDPQAMVNNVRHVGMLLYGLAAADKLPARYTEQELRAMLVEQGLEQPLRIGGDWPWD